MKQVIRIFIWIIVQNPVVFVHCNQLATFEMKFTEDHLKGTTKNHLSTP